MLARARSWLSVPLLVCLAACSSAAAEEIQPIDPVTSNDEVASSETPPSSSTNDDDSTPAPTTPTDPNPEPELVVHSLANIGDSISQGFDADDSKPIDIGAVINNPNSVFFDNPKLSWIQGSDSRVSSVTAHYRALDPNLKVTPVSQSGTELVRHFEKQARAIKQKNATPDLVYVLLGGNDICNRAPSTTADATATLYSVDQWRAAAIKGLDALAEDLPNNATVRVVSMPRVDLLFSQVKDMKVPIVYDSPLGKVTGESTCEQVWAVTAAQSNGICKIVTTQTNAQKRAAIGARIDAYNKALAEEVRKIDTDPARNPKNISFQSDWHGSLDEGAPKNLSGGTFVFEPKHVSKLDCFHPSITGQKDLAQLALTKANWKP